MKLVLTDENEARVGLLEETDGVYLWVGRGDDGEDDERVALLSHRQALKLISALARAVALGTKKGGKRK